MMAAMRRYPHRTALEMLNHVDLETIRWRHKAPDLQIRWRDVGLLLERFDAAIELHTPFNVYRSLEAPDPEYVACMECCVSRERCADKHFHTLDPWDRCPTIQALHGLTLNVAPGR